MRVELASIHKFSSVFLSLAAWFAFFATLIISAASQSQEPQSLATTLPRHLITAPVDELQLTTLHGNTHPLARPEYDLGAAPATLPMERMLLVLKRGTDQEYSLRKLLDNQQDRGAPSYHKWLTPAQFGAQFGPTDADMQAITLWLQSHGFQVGTSKGRTVLEFSGSASQVQEAFHTTIHKYLVNGEQHWANASDPSIPTALAPAVAGVLTLHNFIKKPAIHFNQQPISAKLVEGKKPQVTFTQNGQLIHAMAPQDFEVIYNMNSLTTISNSTIAVVGRSNLYNGGADVSNFLGIFGGGSFQMTLNGPDPGDLGGGEEAEATLDSSWATALSPNSTVNLVVSATTDSTDGIDLSEVFIVENDVAPIMTESFSACELYAGDTQLAFAGAMAEQAAAQGITYIVSAGDDGAEGCDDPSIAPASNPISVNYLASTPFTVAVGGTMFNENGQDSKYWSTTAPISETALSYIPEDVWNESSLTNGLWAGSGGASAGNILSGLGTTGGAETELAVRAIFDPGRWRSRSSRHFADGRCT
jgi:subtilase family serine protease